MSTAELPEVTDDLLTVDDFCAMVRDGQKADLLEGVIYMASPDSKKANQINGFLAFLVRGFIAAKDVGGEVYINRFTFQLDDFNGPEPDLAWVAPDRIHLVEEGRMRGAPDVAVEIVSRDRRQRDWVDKRETYESAGVREYWIIDPVQRRVEFLRLVEGTYQVVMLQDDRVFRSTAISGLWLDTEWLLGATLPNEYECLQSVLSASSA